MASAEEKALARLAEAHHARFLGLQQATGELVGETWDAFANLDDASAARFAAAAGRVVDLSKVNVSTLSVGFQTANDRVGGFPKSGLTPAMPTIRNGIPTPEVYHRSIVQARTMVSAGSSWEEAMAAGRARAVSTARTDVSLSNRAEMQRGGELRPWVVGYRRVLTGKSCGFCATASTQRYKSADLLPLHPVCDCDIAEIYGTEDPGHVLNRELLRDLKSAKAEVGDRPFVVEQDGTIRFAKREPVLDSTGKQVVDPKTGTKLTRTVAGEPVKPAVVDHGELGKTLVDSKHTVSTPSSVEPTRPPRPRGCAWWPPTPIEVRPPAEEKAISASKTKLAADDPDVVAVADRYGVHPDDVLSARARVADVRKIAREEAARVQANAARELDRLDTVRLRNPPRKGAKTGIGSSARRGEWDWLEQVSDREKARLSRRWYGGGQAPDQFAANMSSVLGRDLDVDEAMELWLDLNRTEEAAGALRRGKLPSLDAYSGQIDPKTLLPELEALGYDPAILFGDELAAAGHIASVDAQLVRREAIDFLGDAMNAVEGPAPYRLRFESWAGEVADLEHALANGGLSSAERRRLAELVPQYLDEPGLSFEDLYARIVSTARKAGEEVADDAEIPW